MAVLTPAPFHDLVARLYAEPRLNGSLFGLPRKRWFVPEAAGPDLSVRFHGQHVGNPAGPASGPHTQMAQNLLLAYAAGARLLELKTVQADDHLVIPRPCIDIANVGYNIEFSQELTLEQSLREYVAGAMLIEIFRHEARFAPAALLSRAGDYALDLSLGYDLEGITSGKVQRFLDAARDCRGLVERLRREIPADFLLARSLAFPTRLASSVTLSTFHGCPAEEIERIATFLLAERDLDVIIKLNPSMLGRKRLEHLLHEVMGYSELRVPEHAYSSGLQMGEAIEVVARLSSLARQRGRSFGLKFTNTLEVDNTGTVFPHSISTRYLSGQPLHVLALSLAEEFRAAAASAGCPTFPHPGATMPLSFSAGVDRHNFPLAVACGFVPVSVCTDLLRTGGYGRLPAYLRDLSEAMDRLKARSIDEYILGFSRNPSQSVAEAAAGNLRKVAGMSREEPRYRAGANRSGPNRVGSALETFDCLTCDKCLGVCPNAANFSYPTPLVSLEAPLLLIHPDGSHQITSTRPFRIAQVRQIANFADFCNDCGNCDTFCPESGGPYLKKPAISGSLASFRRSAPRDGFVVLSSNDRPMILGRIAGCEYSLSYDPELNSYFCADRSVSLTFSDDDSLSAVRILRPLTQPHAFDTWIYHALRHLLHGLLDPTCVHQVTASLVPAGEAERDQLPPEHDLPTFTD